MSENESRVEDVTDATGRQILDDIFEESRMRRVALQEDVDPVGLLEMKLPSEPFIGFFAGTVTVDGEQHDDGETLLVASETQQRRYLIKRWDRRNMFKAYQSTPAPGERLRLLNVYRVMTGQAVS